MNNLEYLNHISQTGRSKSIIQPSTKSKSPLFIVKIIVGAVLALTLISVVGNVIKDISSQASEQTKQLYLRINNLNTTLTEYTKLLKSSKLRSIGFSLSSTLAGTSNQLSNYMSTEFGNSKDDLTPKQSILDSETELTTNLNRTLRNAKLNGFLDRIYANEIKLQVSLLLSLDTNLAARNKNETLASILNQFHSNLTVIEESFEAYSNPTD